MTTQSREGKVQFRNDVELLIDIFVENEKITERITVDKELRGVKCTTINFSIQDSSIVLPQSLLSVLRPILCQVFNISDEDFSKGRYKIPNPTLRTPIVVDIKIDDDLIST